MLSIPTLSNFKPFSTNIPNHRSPYHVKLHIRSCSTIPNQQDIDMVRTKSGAYAPKPKKVAVLWDLDNKPPRGPPYEAATSLKTFAGRFGHVADFSAYANRHAFIHLPQWVVEERAQRRNLDRLERKGLVQPSQPYVCSVCGRKFPTNLDLKKHFKQLHERERQKKLNRMRSLKGKKRQRFKERFIDGNEKYNEAARSLLTQKQIEKSVGPGMPFAKSVLAASSPDRVIGLVPCAIGGTKISQWARGQKLYNDMIARTKAAVALGGAKSRRFYGFKGRATPRTPKMLRTIGADSKSLLPTFVLTWSCLR